MPPSPTHAPWSAARLFGALPALSPLRVISPSGPSTFEAILAFGPHGFAGGFMNAIQDAYHWHLRVDGLGYVRSHDDIHARSGRRVLFLELCEREGARPFLWIYLHRAKGEDFEPAREEAFGVLHKELAEGVRLEPAEA